jgi:hypothetical protein
VLEGSSARPCRTSEARLPAPASRAESPARAQPWGSVTTWVSRSPAMGWCPPVACQHRQHSGWPGNPHVYRPATNGDLVAASEPYADSRSFVLDGLRCLYCGLPEALAFVRSTGARASTVIRMPNAAATSARVPSVGLRALEANSRRIVAGSALIARATSALEIPAAFRASSSAFITASMLRIRIDSTTYSRRNSVFSRSPARSSQKAELLVNGRP